MSYTGKMSSLYCFRPLVAILLWQQLHNFITFYLSPPISGQSASVCLPLCNTNTVHTITILISELESPNLHQICTFARFLVKMITEQAVNNQTVREQKRKQINVEQKQNHPKCWQTEIPASRNVDKQSRRHTKQSRNQNINKPKLRHTEKRVIYLFLTFCSTAH